VQPVNARFPALFTNKKAAGPFSTGKWQGEPHLQLSERRFQEAGFYNCRAQ
jgi:hypothetical protein